MAILGVNWAYGHLYRVDVFPEASMLPEIASWHEKISLILPLQNKVKEYYLVRKEAMQVDCLTWTRYWVWDAQRIEELVRGQEALESELEELNTWQIDRLVAFCQVYREAVSGILNRLPKEGARAQWDQNCQLFLKKLVKERGEDLEEVIEGTLVAHNLEVMGSLVSSFGLPAVRAISVVLAKQEEARQEIDFRLREYHANHLQAPSLEKLQKAALQILDAK